MSQLRGIGELAHRSGVPATALRYYDQVGLLVPATRESGRRRYAPEAVVRLHVIQLCKVAGFSLEEIVALYGDREPGRPSSRALATAKLQELDDQIVQLETARSILQLGLRCTCDSLDDCTCAVHDELAALRAASSPGAVSAGLG